MNFNLIIWNDVRVIHKKVNGMCPSFSDLNGNHNVKTDLSGFEKILYSLDTFCKIVFLYLDSRSKSHSGKIICILIDLFLSNFKKPLGWMTRLKGKFIIYTSKTKIRVRYVTKPPSAKPARISGLNSRGEGWWDVERQAGGGEGVASSRSQHAQEVRKTCTTHTSVQLHFTILHNKENLNTKNNT